ncbi:hypothetical protein A3G55_01260 [Candidatus Giovannonibacteria bacterium RIFCSPLOWO2_12_FULL_44_25]|uniref:Aspartate/ornithine carbamoyltransferase carbamoyl-P binding domain-containing protein n=2 Tax=Candidatus Giovannoniibacteriota TaxID=1752738 RepID=A0A1F5W8Y9_9BACT|nr:MAG: Aspartate carbamoyltransferase catalytic chain [Parcubacteria group bacterium GW2011_GWC1_44_10]KKT59202.1 MAG: Aspartate carbamoyltransferase catalytic chain [Candidatus Giovannonibacteria bacterium GW2011_GWA1_44_25]KKU29926.1 MAG: Aspartate carbamoyltransferase catalytic chain [Candidatus Giovannonibacteria bacterium GW2011_GWB1_46_20]OGF50560.1 MAG: hypothetical protein A2120_04005 [Candidatus Giovannonibacteria bacterium GWA2_45_15]OGF60310.1 MAG: hypothetical protein A2W40_04060 [
MNDRLKHILSSRQFTLGFLVNLYKDVRLILDLMKTREGRELLTCVLSGHVIGEFFWQESSRTYHSSAVSAQRLGADVNSERGVQKTRLKNGKRVTRWELIFSSEMKDAHFEDEVRAWASFYDALILRTAEEGLVGRAAAICDEFGYNTHCINAGDGKGEHPTQTLVDGFSICSGLGLDIEHDWQKLKNYTVAFINDPKHSRVIHSLATMLAKLNMRLVSISPPGFEMPKEILADLRARYPDVNIVESNEFLPADVYYITRLQEEYFRSEKKFKKYRSYFSVTKKVADKYGVKVVMHPFPRSKHGNELPIWLPNKPETWIDSLDKDPRAMYFYQMAVSVPVRMALLKYLLNPGLDLNKLRQEKLIHGIKNQCVVCSRMEYYELGWTEFAPKGGYLQGLPHVICPKCQPTMT